MPVLSKDGKNFLFVHIPKTGGTTVEKTFQNAGFEIKYRTSAGTPVNKVTRCTPQHFHGELLESIFHLDRFDGIFTVVRHPYTRIQSEYAMRTKKIEKYANKIVLKWLKRKTTEFSANPFVNDNHIRPQADFLVPKTQVFKLEDGLEEMFSSLCKEYDIDVPFKSNYKAMQSVNVSGNSSSNVELNKEALKLADKFYAKDFRKFDYKKDFQQKAEKSDNQGSEKNKKKEVKKETTKKNANKEK